MEKARLLLIEDESDVLALNKKHLESQGYRVLCASTLKEARNIVWETPPDLILLDVMMPDGSGYDFCAEIRGTTTAPILFLTCLDRDENLIKGLAGGGDDYLTKPYNLDVLSARIMALLRRSGFAGAGRVELPPLAIDLLSGTVTLAGENIPLSQKELQLLALLAGNAGKDVAVSAIYETIWGESADTSAQHTVAVHISNLRKKLRFDDASAFELRSNYGKSYSLLKVRYDI